MIASLTVMWNCQIFQTVSFYATLECCIIYDDQDLKPFHGKFNGDDGHQFFKIIFFFLFLFLFFFKSILLTNINFSSYYYWYLSSSSFYSLLLNEFLSMAEVHLDLCYNRLVVALPFNLCRSRKEPFLPSCRLVRSMHTRVFLHLFDTLVVCMSDQRFFTLCLPICFIYTGWVNGDYTGRFLIEKYSEMIQHMHDYTIPRMPYMNRLS